MSLIEQAAKRLEELRRAGRRNARRQRPQAQLSPVVDRAASRPTSDCARSKTGRRARTLAAASEPLRIVASRRRCVACDGNGPTPSHTRRTIEIDLERLSERGFVTPDAPKSQIADEFRVIKRPIIRNALGRDGTNSQEPQPGDGHQRAAGRRQDVHRRQPGA